MEHSLQLGFFATPARGSRFGRGYIKALVVRSLGPRSLLFPNPRQIPDTDAFVIVAAREDGLLVWMPAETVDLRVVSLQQVEFQLQVLNIPEGVGFIGGGAGDVVVAGGVEGDAIDGVGVVEDWCSTSSQSRA